MYKLVGCFKFIISTVLSLYILNEYWRRFGGKNQ